MLPALVVVQPEEKPASFVLVRNTGINLRMRCGVQAFAAPDS